MGKYFKYAIGEILLVVLGILIALQINNWNESNKDVEKEQTYLKNLKEDLKGIIEAYEVANNVESIILLQSKDILRHYERNNGFYNMDTVFAKLNDLTVRWNVAPTATTLVELINSGQTKLIRNPNLRKELVAFNEQLNLWSANTINNNTNLVDNIIVPEILKLGTYSAVGPSKKMLLIFDKFSSESFMTTNDMALTKISTDQLNQPEHKLNIVNLINYRRSLASLQMGVNDRIIIRVKEVLKMIELELTDS
jgi:hypothetical protein